MFLLMEVGHWSVPLLGSLASDRCHWQCQQPPWAPLWMVGWRTCSTVAFHKPNRMSNAEEYRTRFARASSDTQDAGEEGNGTCASADSIYNPHMTPPSLIKPAQMHRQLTSHNSSYHYSLIGSSVLFIIAISPQFKENRSLYKAMHPCTRDNSTST